MLDGINSGPDRVFDTGRTDSVGGGPFPGFVSLLDGRSHFVNGQLSRAGFVAFGKHPTGRAHFDDIYPVLDLTPGFFAGFVRAIYDSAKTFDLNVRAKVSIAMASGDRQNIS